jgi:hypothetical protein
MIEMYVFIATWIILAFFDNATSVYSISLYNKLPKEQQKKIKNSSNLQTLFVKKFGIIPGFIAAVLTTTLVIIIVGFLLFKYVDSSISGIIFILIVILDLVLIFGVSIPKIIKCKKLLS